MRHIGQVTSEGQYFYQLDVELIDNMRRCAALEERRRRMAEASQINDSKLLEVLEKLGHNPTTVSLLYFAPLVQVAWANGSVSRAERHRVLAIASMYGVQEDTSVYQQLVGWLDHPPSKEFFEGTLRVIRDALKSMPRNERRARQRALMQCCMDVASVSVWHLTRVGGSERKLIEEIEKQLELQEAVSASAEAQG